MIIQAMFENDTSLKDFTPISNWNTSNVTRCDYIFNNCSNVTGITLNWDTSKVTNMYKMFCNSKSLYNVELSGSTKSVTTMEEMFKNCSSLNQIIMPKFSLKSAKTLKWMNAGCKNLENLDYFRNNTDTSSNLTSLCATFEDCVKVTDITPLTSITTDNVTDMTYLFNRMTNLGKTDEEFEQIKAVLKKWNVSNVTSWNQFKNNTGDKFKNAKQIEFKDKTVNF